VLNETNRYYNYTRNFDIKIPIGNKSIKSVLHLQMVKIRNTLTTK
jgi:hypothetical protein